jgi:hypothetical protein
MNEEIDNLLNEIHQMLDNGTAEIVYQDVNQLLIRRSDSSGLIILSDGDDNIIQVGQIKYVSSIDESMDKVKEIIDDRSPGTIADDLLRQVFK